MTIWIDYLIVADGIESSAVSQGTEQQRSLPWLTKETFKDLH